MSQEHQGDAFTIGIIGGGFVGKATALLADGRHVQCLVYDKDASKCSPPGLKLEDLKVAHFIFICVPTPMNADGSCYTAIVESVIRECNEAGLTAMLIVRSTVPVGFCARFNVCFMPEFLTEKNWHSDFINNKEWILGIPESLDNVQRQKYTRDFDWLLCLSRTYGFIQHSESTVMTTSEAEMLKYMRNCFLATKVSLCNEFDALCSKKNIDYNKVAEVAFGRDDRIGASHIKVPGHDGHRGYGGTCFPKDMNSLVQQFKQANVQCLVLQAAVQRNELVDRAEKDWCTSDEFKGRAVVCNSANEVV